MDGNSDWDVRFFEDNGNTIEITMANIPAQTTKNFLAKVTIDGGEKVNVAPQFKF